MGAIPLLEVMAVMLAAAALTISLHMSFEYFHIGLLPGVIGRLMRKSCDSETGNCSTVLSHPSASLLGLPNSVYGILYYLLTIITILTQSWLLLWIVRWASIITLLMSAYLTYVLTRQLKARCILCFVAHTINAVLAMIMWNIPVP